MDDPGEGHICDITDKNSTAKVEQSIIMKYDYIFLKYFIFREACNKISKDQKTTKVAYIDIMQQV